MDPWGMVKTFLIVCLVFIPLERLFALKPGQPIFRKGWRVDLTHVLLTGLMIQLAHVLVIAVIVELLKGQLSPAVGRFIREQPLWLQYLEVLLIADLGFYWMHRLFHERARLWTMHAIHHSSEQLDFLAAYRVHPIDQFMVRSVTLLPVFVLGFDMAALVIFVTIYHWQAMLLHSNTRFRFGGLERVVATPAFHHWHHARRGTASCNFAGQLALIDWIFETYYLPAGMPDAYGVDEPTPQTYAGQMLAAFRPGLAAPRPHVAPEYGEH